MKIFALLPALLLLLLLWPMAKLAKKGWRLFAVLFFAALVTGCASTSNTFDKSPCACGFKNINTGNYGSKGDA
ncbi:hypothetical protein [Xanthomonas phaseoli]|uniref:Uncharacterized protein n=1 Tax=Xanthomonas manihotis TaxID=43353 RepID=A0A8I1XP04_XANMN|nr:hypothetical protein [Xanthomonas phaseoli]KUF37523.1 hypothetical protein AO826_18840 [Xanthomonas phaseoli pv. manihotis]MBO9721539.1 hypothetical protein [Xanthomonas phaseoli pv. manihotis]MBO9757359.1 hypothetical protein [Xanthomonas phaseoli pv. manihotis]MBO9761782.1 hypothetical protein [Xanthomonas phaseoli pv. manihotis]MBO9766045.1 hypothetical protein [Xanthomonas phaseoli pv. manihotis]